MRTILFGFIVLVTLGVGDLTAQSGYYGLDQIRAFVPISANRHFQAPESPA